MSGTSIAAAPTDAQFLAAVRAALGAQDGLGANQSAEDVLAVVRLARRLLTLWQIQLVPVGTFAAHSAAGDPHQVLVDGRRVMFLNRQTGTAARHITFVKGSLNVTAGDLFGAGECQEFIKLAATRINDVVKLVETTTALKSRLIYAAHVLHHAGGLPRGYEYKAFGMTFGEAPNRKYWRPPAYVLARGKLLSTE